MCFSGDAQSLRKLKGKSRRQRMSLQLGRSALAPAACAVLTKVAMERNQQNGVHIPPKYNDSSQSPPSERQAQPQTATRTPSKRTKFERYLAREGVRAQNVKKALEALHPEDVEINKIIEEMSSPPCDVVAPEDEYGFRDTSHAPDLAHYQKFISTPKTTRSMTQSSRGNQTQGDADDDPNTDGALSMAESDIPRISAFAKLEFDDGEFYMNTYSVELGRDLSSARQAVQDAEEPAENTRSKRRKRSASSGPPSRPPRKVKRKHGRHHPSSVVSENGGVIAVDRSDSESVDGHIVKKTKSTSSSSLQMSRKGSMLFAPQATDYQALAMASLLGSVAFRQFAGSNLPIPAPEACPLIPIHPPVSGQTQTDESRRSSGEGAIEDAVGSYKAISRKHVRIAFCFEKHYFQIHILGRNGAYVDDEFCAAGDVRPLTNGSSIQIGGVSVKFQLPDVAPGDTGAESNTNADYTFNSRSGYIERSGMESSSEADNEDDEPEDAEEEVEEESDRPRRASRKAAQKASTKRVSKNVSPIKVKVGKSGKSGKQAPPKPEMAPPVQKRKGPGRPPKNGIMSKREQAILARQAREQAKAAVQKGTNGESAQPKEKASPEANLEDSSTQPNGKRKYTKRKSRVELMQGQQGTRESTEHTDSVAPEQIAPSKSAKEKKPPKPPRSPSPVIDRNSLTDEQLAKPTASYVVLIHEALTEHAEQGKGPMSLHQIYSSIARKYPYFKFIVTTVGWQSSIRHNLLQHEAFEKIEREGKGWMWGLKAGVSIEKEKKRRTTPPQSHPQYYPPPHMMQHPFPYYPGMPPPPNGYMLYPQYGPPPGVHPGMRPPPSYPSGPFPPPHRAPGQPLPIINAAADTSSSYQSPYAPSQKPNPPPPASEAPISNGASPKERSQPQQAPNASPIAAPNPQPPATISTEKQHKLDHFRAAVMQSMPDKTFGEHLLSSAIARSLGTQTHSTLPGHGANLPEHPQELFIMQTVRKILDEAPKKAQTPGGSTERGGDGGGGWGPGEAGGKVGGGLVEKGGEEEVKREGEGDATENAPPPAENASVPSKGFGEESKATDSSKPTTAGVDNNPAASTPQEPQTATGSEG